MGRTARGGPLVALLVASGLAAAVPGVAAPGMATRRPAATARRASASRPAAARWPSSRPGPAARQAPSSRPNEDGRDPASSPPAAPARADAPVVTERIAEIRFHGNYSIPDEELLAAIRVRPGDPLEEGTLEAIEQRLLATGRVGWVEIRKRYRSLARSDDVVLVIAVREKVSTTDKLMFLPVISVTDEYGLTYGVRLTTIDLLGTGERLSFPFTWGGEKRAGVEGRVAPGIVDAIDLGLEIRQRENPHFDIDDTRTRLQARAHRRAGPFAVDFGLRWENVDFTDLGGGQLAWGAGVRFDTRQDVNLPRDAVYAGAEWERLHLLDGDADFHRYTVDVRGFKSLFGHTVLGVQALYRGVDGRLPDHERPFLGGGATLRGHRAGDLIGDVLALSTVELRWPVSAPTWVGQAGFHFFFDAATVYDHGTSIREARFRKGVGAGAFVFAAVIGLKVELAWDLDDSVRVHFGTGFRF